MAALDDDRDDDDDDEEEEEDCDDDGCAPSCRERGLEWIENRTLCDFCRSIHAALVHKQGL
jgi:hypothetical protein